MALNIINAKFCEGRMSAWTSEQWQWDYGQILQFEGLELPEAYEVHFSNIAIGGESITQIGGENGVTIPDQFFTTGKTIYAWVYLHQGEDDGETEYSVTIPVKKRPKPSDTPPTPEEQSAIDQAIAALNVAVGKSETAITHYPHIQDGTWWVWDVTTETWVDTEVEAQGEPGQPGRDGTDGTDGVDGFSPVITVTDITGGHRVTITDATSTKTIDVMNGQPGTPGTDGTDGYSPTVTVTEITGGHRVVITDKNGSHTFDVMDGSGATVTVDDELSPTSTNPVQNKVIDAEVVSLKAEISNKIDKPETAGTSGQVLTSDGDGGQSWETPSSPPVSDVQVNGTSVVNQGVANVPLMDGTTFGVAKVSSSRGTYIDGNGNITISRAYTPDVRNGANQYVPIVPINQHEAVFYGLTKVAGENMAQSSNPVGTYTDAAKIAIQKMLGIYEAPWELIREDTFTNETEANHEITTDANGNPLELTDLILMFETPKQSTPSSFNNSGGIFFYPYNRGRLLNEHGSWTQAAEASAHGCVSVIKQIGNMLEVSRIQQTTVSNTGSFGGRYGSGFPELGSSDRISYSILNEPTYFVKIIIGQVTGTGHYKLYGRRKWS